MCMERARIHEMVKNVLLAFALSAPLFCPAAMQSQTALPTATQPVQLSAFGGFGGVFTGLAGGKNLDVMAGVDLGLPPVHGIRPVIEGRGAYPIHRGNVDSQKSILGGVKAEFLLNHPMRPYADFLLGRGAMHYSKGGYQFGNLVYQLSTTNVYSFGGGVDYDLTDHLGVRLDGQFQKWGYAPTASGNVYAKVVSVAVVYRFSFDRRHPH